MIDEAKKIKSYEVKILSVRIECVQGRVPNKANG